MKKGDLIIILASLLLAGIVFVVYSASHLMSDKVLLIIKSEGKIITSLQIDATTSASYHTENQYGYNNIEVINGVVNIHNASCKNQICVHEAGISKVGQSIICLPNRVSIEIIGKKNDEIDDVSY